MGEPVTRMGNGEQLENWIVLGQNGHGRAIEAYQKQL
jgi:hypothetical protein